MIKLFLLTAFLLLSANSLHAAESLGAQDTFMQDLGNAKNPFEDGYPPPVIVIKKEAPPKKEIIKHVSKPKPIPKPVAEVKVTLPALSLQGVFVGEDIHEAIINEKVVALHGIIEGAKVVAITKRGVSLVYKGKKFFLKVE